MLPISDCGDTAIPPASSSSSAFEARMRRAVQQENRSLEAGPPRGSRRTSSTKRPRGKSAPRRGPPFPCGKVLLVLSPLVLVAAAVMAARTFSSWTKTENEIATLMEEADLEVERRRRKQEEKEGQDGKDRDNNNNNNIREVLVLTTKHGAIKILLRPDLSEGSVRYLHQMLEKDVVCHRCNFYRAEKPGILQGVMAHRDVTPNDVRGKCPEDGSAAAVHNKCPEWDADCGCHGPVMTKGSVAWAAGQAGGPDFFINNYNKPATFWGTQHTNFGSIVVGGGDDGSFDVIERIFALPVRKEGGMSYLEETIHFDMTLELMEAAEEEDK